MNYRLFLVPAEMSSFPFGLCITPVFRNRAAASAQAVRGHGVGAGGRCAPRGLLPTLRISLQEESCIFLLFLKCLAPGSGRKIPAIWHGACTYPGVFIPETKY